MQQQRQAGAASHLLPQRLLVLAARYSHCPALPDPSLPHTHRPVQRVTDLTTKPIIVVLVHGGPLDVSEMEATPRVGAILTLWFPGQTGSAALGDILVGKIAPSGVCAGGAWCYRLARLSAAVRAEQTQERPQCAGELLRCDTLL